MPRPKFSVTVGTPRPCTQSIRSQVPTWIPLVQHIHSSSCIPPGDAATQPIGAEDTHTTAPALPLRGSRERGFAPDGLGRRVRDAESRIRHGARKGQEIHALWHSGPSRQAETGNTLISLISRVARRRRSWARRRPAQLGCAPSRGDDPSRERARNHRCRIGTPTPTAVCCTAAQRRRATPWTKSSSEYTDSPTSQSQRI